LDIGSIDMIYTTDNKYVFLEVNPSGQFLGYSDTCNYCIEKKIAEFLIKKQNEKD
jgi:D-alanine-D-alanine ligase-like ATP-grasp enzyme